VNAAVNGSGPTAHPTRPRALIKAVFLDQSTVAGFGNVYADETLHLARIDPRRPADSLTTAETDRLYAAIRTVLAAAVEHRGISFVDYINTFRGSDTYLARSGGGCVPARGSTVHEVRNAHPTHPGRWPRDEHLPALPAVSTLALRG